MVIEVVHPDDESVACDAFDSSYVELVSPMAMPLNPVVELEKFALAVRTYRPGESVISDAVIFANDVELESDVVLLCESYQPTADAWFSSLRFPASVTFPLPSSCTEPSMVSYVSTTFDKAETPTSNVASSIS